MAAPSKRQGSKTGCASHDRTPTATHVHEIRVTLDIRGAIAVLSDENSRTEGAADDP